MRQYLDLMRHVLENGSSREDRTGTGTVGIFGHQMRFDLSEGFPLVTTKKLHLRSILHELLWFLRGETNVRSLQDVGVRIWNEWADEEGELGPIYGYQWRSWQGADGAVHDQILEAQRLLREVPYSRRILVSAWNVAQIDEMALPPCHTVFQFHVQDGRLSCQLYQRSADIFLGLPFNIASYALLTTMMAGAVGLEPGDFVHTLGDAHLYRNHLEQAAEQLRREPRPLPRLVVDGKVSSVLDYRYEQFRIEGYDPHPHIKAPVAV